MPDRYPPHGPGIDPSSDHTRRLGPDQGGQPGGRSRADGLRRLSRLTWRSTQLSAIAAAAFAILFARSAPAQTASSQHPVRPASTPVPAATVKHKAARHKHHAHRAPVNQPAAQPSSAAAQPASAAPTLAPPTTPPAAAPSPSPVQSTSSGSHSGG